MQQSRRHISQGIKLNNTNNLVNSSYKSQRLIKKNATSIALPVSLSLTHIIFSFFVLGIMIYLYMVTSIVLATINRKALEDTVRNETTELSYKETVYGQKVGEITLSKAYDLGFEDSSENLFTTKYREENLTLNN